MATGKLKIPTRSGFLLLALEEIVYCEADGNYTNIMFTSGQLHITSINLGAIQEMLPRDKFFRLSRSVIVNTAMISELNKGKLCCLLKINGNEFSFHITPAPSQTPGRIAIDPSPVEHVLFSCMDIYQFQCPGL
ncbi:MAG: LytTR family DNA-binding domain-containing protein [Cyclobacteriaceae bacterium]|nr:LytTR family DNA-binding domain-containing protein [Cyclobacteriaceae bacterium]